MRRCEDVKMRRCEDEKMRRCEDEKMRSFNYIEDCGMKILTIKKLEKDFYLRGCLTVAKELIGKVLVRKKGRKVYSGIIVETEAYLGDKDEASHSYRGKTKRNSCMFDKGGSAYVYFTYGNHFCVNAVVGKAGVAHAVLLRAVEPVRGIEYMKKNRAAAKDIYNLTNGPGKLTQAFEIDLKLNGADLHGSELFIASQAAGFKFKIKRSKRIGISKNTEKLYRFYAEGSPFVTGAGVKYRALSLRKRGRGEVVNQFRLNRNLNFSLK